MSQTKSVKDSSPITKKIQALWADKRTYVQRLLPAGAAAFAFCFTFLFFGPFEMIAFGGNAMTYGWQDIWWFLALTALIVFAATTLLVSLLKGKLFNCAVNLLFSLTVCGYLQAALMNGSLGILNGNPVDWHNSTGSMLLNLFAWAILFTGFSFVLYLSRKLWSKMVNLICILLAVMQLASTFSIVLGSTTGKNDIEDYALTDAGMYQYANRDNIFVFVLDRLDFDYIQDILKQDPDFFGALDGFTGYNNAISAYARTQPALNHLLTGSETAYTCSTDDFYKNSWTEDGKDLLGGMKAQGYTVEIYTTLQYLFSDLSYAQNRVDNIRPTETLDPMAALPKLLQLSAYRYSPIALKPFFWADTSYYNSDVFVPGGNTFYHYDDAGYAPGFVTATADRSQPGFKLYHFFGSHNPCTMNADGTASDGTTSVREQTMGCFRNLFAAFKQMKELGIYEDATIIITADHGAAVSDRKPLQKQTRIGLFYKPSGSAGTPFVWSGAPICTDNISATLAQAAGIRNASAYGVPLEDVAEDSGVVRYYYKTECINGSSDERTVYKYAVTGDAADFRNWEIVEIIEDLPDENGFY